MRQKIRPGRIPWTRLSNWIVAGQRQANLMVGGGRALGCLAKNARRNAASRCSHRLSPKDLLSTGSGARLGAIECYNAKGRTNFDTVNRVWRGG